MYKIKCITATYQNCRENNEDNYFVNSIYANMNHSDEKFAMDFTDNRKNIFAVFDGLGGEEKGEEASFTAAKALKNFKSIDEYYKKANREIYKKTAKKSGTTAAILEIYNGSFTCSNIGDSRVYLIRNNEIRQLSKDHTSIQTMIDAGVITKEQAEKSKYKNTLSQCLGIYEEEVVISPFVGKKERLCDGDIFLICSDGLTGGVDDKEIFRTVSENGVDVNTVEVLFRKAVSNGARDNVTMVLLSVSVRKGNGIFNKIRRIVKYN